MRNSRAESHRHVRQNSVLLPPGRAGGNIIKDWRPWLPAGAKKWRMSLSVCPTCADDPDRGVPLVAGIGLMGSCPEHGCCLELGGPVRVGLALGEPVPARPAPEPVAALDRLTWEGLTTGHVPLPARQVHVGVWLRLLRTLLDEVSLSDARLGKTMAARMARIWKTAGHQVRGGLNIWRSYERLDSAVQEAMMAAAAVALHQVASGRIIAEGSLGHLLTRPRHEHVYDGDRPRPRSLPGFGPDRWTVLHQEIAMFMEMAKTDQATARQVLHIFTWRCKTLEAFEDERRFLISHGFPADLLPDARGMGRHDLLPPGPSAAAGRPVQR